MAKPVKPSEVANLKSNMMPDAVLEAFNELIAENYGKSSATVYTKDAVARMVAKGLNEKEIFKKGWLDVEDIYRKAGWTVTYDSPGWDESYDAHFVFKGK